MNHGLGLNTGELLRLARRDPAQALGPLLERYRHYLQLLARLQIGRQLRGKVDASDVVQEVFLEAHRHFYRFAGSEEAQLACWLRNARAASGRGPRALAAPSPRVADEDSAVPAAAMPTPARGVPPGPA